MWGEALSVCVLGEGMTYCIVVIACSTRVNRIGQGIVYSLLLLLLVYSARTISNGA